MQVAFRKEAFGRVSVYSDFVRAKTIPHAPLPAGQVRITASQNESAATRLMDDNPRTYWEATNSCGKESWIQLDFARTETISRIVIGHTGFPGDFVGLSGIMGQTGAGWTNVVEQDINKARARFEFRNGHPVYSTDAMTFDFPPFQTAALRLMFHGPTVNCRRVIGGLKVYRTD
jgi:hypothetical protein